MRESQFFPPTLGFFFICHSNMLKLFLFGVYCYVVLKYISAFDDDDDSNYSWIGFFTSTTTQFSVTTNFEQF